jgi:HD-GYP domain-containing protein (c-di-GMP phosphodiesterase class II)
VTPEAAVEELTRCAGTQFDPVVVEVFLDGLASQGIVPMPAVLTAIQ